MLFNKNVKFLGVGDITTDAFIKLKDANVSCDIDKEKCKLCFNFKDKVQYEDVFVTKAVGNAANASVCAARLGLKSGLVSDVGDDHEGGECIATLRKNGVHTDHISIHKDRETNYHYVLWFDSDRTILVKHQEYDYKFPDINPPEWLYLSSLAENSEPYHMQIAEYLNQHPEINFVFQPGTFQMKLGRKLAEIYKRSKLFFCNIQEAQRILETQESDVKELMKKINDFGPEICVITDGPKGAYAFDGKEMWFMPPYPDPKTPFERTGAGDALSSTVAVALALGKTLPEALMWGPINSMSVVQHVGAQEGLLTREKLEEYLADAPADYRPQKI
jgi:sugar/nucleoside kinase (ribokinase family)